MSVRSEIPEIRNVRLTLHELFERQDELNRKVLALKTRINELVAELLERKGPCENPRCRLYHEHNGPCEQGTVMTTEGTE